MSGLGKRPPESQMIDTVFHYLTISASLREQMELDPNSMPRPYSITLKKKSLFTTTTLWSSGTYQYDGAGNVNIGFGYQVRHTRHSQGRPTQPQCLKSRIQVPLRSAAREPWRPERGQRTGDRVAVQSSTVPCAPYPVPFLFCWTPPRGAVYTALPTGASANW